MPVITSNLCDMFQYFLPATWEYLKTTRKDRMKCSFAALKEFDTKLQLHVYSFYKFYISRTITFFRNCWVLQDVYIEWSQIISEQFFNKGTKKSSEPHQTFGWLVLAIWKRADWLVFYETPNTFCFSLKKHWPKMIYDLLRPILTHPD